MLEGKLGLIRIILVLMLRLRFLVEVIEIRGKVAFLPLFLLGPSSSPLLKTSSLRLGGLR